MIPNAYAISYDYVQFKNGYPVYSVVYGENDIRLCFIPTLTDEMLTENMISRMYGYETGDIYDTLPKKIKEIIKYRTSEGSKLILKNGERYKLTRKETLFFLNRKMIPKEDIPLLP